MVIQQNRYIEAAQQLIRLWSGAMGQGSGPVAGLRAELEALGQQVGVDLEVARRLTPESLELLVSPSDATDSLRCWILAEMLFLSARLSEAEGDGEAAREAAHRALHLFERVDPESTPEADLPDPGSRIEEIRGWATEP
jgi:hypothetical protein